MRWYNKMYLGKSIQGKKMYYKYAIQHTKRLTGTYCLMPAACKDDLIDICGSDLLRVSKQYPKDPAGYRTCRQLQGGLSAGGRDCA